MNNYEIHVGLDCGHYLSIIVAASSRKAAVDKVFMMLESLLLQGRVSASDMFVKQIDGIEEMPGAVFVSAASVL